MMRRFPSPVVGALCKHARDALTLLVVVACHCAVLGGGTACRRPHRLGGGLTVSLAYQSSETASS